MFAFSQVHLHHNGCFHSCALTSTCLLLLVCAYIAFCVHLCTPSPKVWIFSCASTYECLHVPFCACIKCLLFSRVRPHQMSAFTRVRLHQNICFFYIEMVACHCVREHLNVSFFSCVPYQNSCFFSVVRLHRFFSLYLYLPISNFLPILVRVILNACLFECTLVHLL